MTAKRLFLALAPVLAALGALLYFHVNGVGKLVIPPLQTEEMFEMTEEEIHAWFSAIHSDPPGKTKLGELDRDGLLFMAEIFGSVMSIYSEENTGVSMDSPYWKMMRKNWPTLTAAYKSKHPGSTKVKLNPLFTIVLSSMEWAEADRRLNALRAAKREE